MRIFSIRSAGRRLVASAGAASALRADMLFDAYLANYDQAIFQGWTLEALKERAGEQIAILLAGVRRG